MQTFPVPVEFSARKRGRSICPKFRGIHPPEAMMHFPLLSDIPPISEKFLRLRRKFSQFYLFRKRFSIFICQNFLWLFLVIDHKFVIFPSIFALSVYFPLFRKNLHSLLWQIPPSDFVKFLCFFTYFLWFSFPPTLTMMHLCITQCSYWTHLPKIIFGTRRSYLYVCRRRHLISIFSPALTRHNVENGRFVFRLNLPTCSLKYS